MYDNLPVVKLGLVATSRDCFPIALSAKRKAALVDAYTKAGGEIVDIPTIIENENDTMKALDELRAAGCNALVVFLGNFGPEGPETMLAEKFGGPTMFVAAAEETQEDLFDGRGDAYCGMLNASYSIALRNLKNVYIPEFPVGTADEIATLIFEFLPIATVRIGLSNLKVFSFGPRPYDFLACNAPIKPLFDLGINIQENSELDLFEAFNKHANDPRIPEVAADMAKECGADNPYAGILPKLAQYELTLLDWAEANKRRLRHWFFSTDLTFYIRGGRVKPLTGHIGNLLNICPLLDVNKDGKLIQRENLRGKRKVVKRIVECMAETAENGLDYAGRVFISQSACQDDAKAVADLISERFPNVHDIETFYIGTTIGAHTGPGTVALFFWGTKRGE